ncbi:MAG: FAD-dependent oxidoreductase [Mesorhizobium amorphae]|nr:MAG: FAD-dependent oxidoreductase [Mesorhizobium amorphae]
MSASRTVLIVGGGASGTILAHALLRREAPDLRVVIVEKREALGRGLAYSTREPDHLLNVAATNMGAMPDQPRHFAEWLGPRADVPDLALFHAPRMLFGDYLGALVAPALADGRLVHLRATCLSLGMRADGSVEARLDDGTRVVAGAAVLATGHDEAQVPSRPFAVRFAGPEDLPEDRSAPVLIMGTGLSMADAWLSLQRREHRGSVTAVSRRGLFPARHRPNQPLKLDRADIPFGTDLTYFMGWFRDLVHETEAKGGDWRDVVDGLRPFNQQIWRNWPAGAKRRFFEHTKAWWDIHRHRMAPSVHTRVSRAVAQGAIRLFPGRLIHAEKAEGGWTATLQRRRTRKEETVFAATILDCTGIATDPAQGGNPLIRSLIAAGTARTDPLRIGLDVTLDCRLVDREGKAEAPIFAVGPPTRGAFLEIDAVPDIRVQCQRVAEGLLG